MDGKIILCLIGILRTVDTENGNSVRGVVKKSNGMKGNRKQGDTDEGGEMKLEDIGFYTLENNRAKNTSIDSPLWRCELLLTDRCNFNCPYCRGVKIEDKGDISKEDAFHIIDLWAEHGLKNVRFSGGEPTLWYHLHELVEHTKSKGVRRIAISTNGSADYEYYKRLISAGVNDFSISLDACCASTGKAMSGRNDDVWFKVVNNIRNLSKLTYTTVGVVLTDSNMPELRGILQFASSLGVADIRIIPAAQHSRCLPNTIEQDVCLSPILRYRINNIKNGRGVRGITEKDNHRCPLVLDDMAVLNGKHYPCIIYLREYGQEIGKINGNIETVRKERESWFKSHDTFNDKICKENCLDVCVDYNNMVLSCQILPNPHLW